VQKSPQGGIVKKKLLFKYLTYLDPKTKETTRVGIRVEGDKKSKISKSIVMGIYLD
jgi:large subunit ribosomal protein L24